MTSITLYISDLNEKEEEVKSELTSLNFGEDSSLEWLAPRKNRLRVRVTSTTMKLLKAAQRKVESRVFDLGGDTSLSLTKKTTSGRRRW